MSSARRGSVSSCRDVILWSPPAAPPSVLAVCASAGWRVVSYLVGLIVDTSSATAVLAADAIVPTSLRRMAEPSIAYPSSPAVITFTDPWRPQSQSPRIRADSLDVGHLPRSRTGSFDPSALGTLQRRGSAGGGRSRQQSAPNVLLSSAASCPGQLASIADGTTTSALWSRRRLASASPLPVSIPELDGSSTRRGQRRGSTATIDFAPPTRSPLSTSMSSTDVRLPPVQTVGRAWGRPATPLTRSIAAAPSTPLVESPAPMMASSPSVWSWWGGGLAAMASSPIVREISTDDAWSAPDRPATPVVTEFVTWRMVRYLVMRAMLTLQDSCASLSSLSVSTGLK